MRAEKFKIAVWGLGKHAVNNIIPALISSQNIDFAGVYSRNPDVVDKCVKQYQCQSWSSENEFLAESGIDVIYLSTPIGLHAEQGKKILNAGKHFWCEKPIASNYDDVLNLIELAELKNLTILEGFMYLYHPQFIWLKECIKKQKMGEIKTITCNFGLPFLESPGFRYTAALGGSALLDIGCYPLSAVLELFVEQDPVIERAAIKGMKGYNVDMEGNAILHFPSGIDAFIAWGMGRSYRNEIDIWGTQGSLYTDKIFSKPEDYAPVINIRSINGKQDDIRIDSANHFELMFKYFDSLLSATKDVISNENKRLLRRMRFLEEIKKYGEN